MLGKLAVNSHAVCVDPRAEWPSSPPGRVTERRSVVHKGQLEATRTGPPRYRPATDLCAALPVPIHTRHIRRVRHDPVPRGSRVALEKQCAE